MRRSFLWLALVVVLLLGAGVVVLTDGNPFAGGVGEQASAEDPDSDDCFDQRPQVRKPSRPAAVFGVASFNVDRTAGAASIRDNVRRLLRRPEVDLVGWQEADTRAFAKVSAGMASHGWRTKFFDVGNGSLQVPISWRTTEFELVGTRTQWMTAGAGPALTTDDFRPKWVTAVTLRHRDSRLVLTMLNTHVANHIETGDQWQDNVNAAAARRHYRRLSALLAAPGHVRVATGDFQWDHIDDTAALPRGGITRTFKGKAVNSFQALGLEGVCPTRYTRYIDYVWLDQSSVDSGTAQFVTHRSLDGFHSDHRPMTARIALMANH